MVSCDGHVEHGSVQTFFDFNSDEVSSAGIGITRRIVSGPDATLP